MLNYIITGVGLYLLYRKYEATKALEAAATNGSIYASASAGTPLSTPPPGMVWVALMNGSHVLMRADDPLRAAID